MRGLLAHLVGTLAPGKRCAALNHPDALPDAQVGVVRRSRPGAASWRAPLRLCDGTLPAGAVVDTGQGLQQCGLQTPESVC